MEAHTSLVVIGFHKKYCHPDAWKTATTRPLPHIGSRNLVRSAVDFLAPRSGGTDGVEVVARVQKDNFETVLRGSGGPQIYLCRGAKLRCRHFCQAGLAQSKHLSEQGRPGVPSSGQRCRLTTEDFSTILGVRSSGPRNHANVKMRRSWCGQNQENHSGKSKGCEILGECPRKPRATSDSETSARWKRVDGRDSSRCHHSHPGSRQQPGSHASLALAKVATVGQPATSAISSAGRRGRAATGTHGVGAVDCDNCRTARGSAAFTPNRR